MVLPFHLRSLLILALILSAMAEEKLIFILSGQSNMSGRGGVVDNHWDGIVPPECKPDPSIQRFSAKLNWEEARDPLHADIDVHAVTGIGPGMAFANGVRATGSVRGTVGLVPCAIGNTSIDQWAKGTPLYESMVQRTKAAVGAGGGRVAALLWYQGESDTGTRDQAESYKFKMERLIQNVRSDLGLPDLLVIQVALASQLGPFTKTVRQAQKEIKMPNVLTVDAMGLQVGSDYIHLTTQAQVKLGKMLATAYYSTHARYLQSPAGKHGM